jgi:hypothetical protein
VSVHLAWFSRTESLAGRLGEQQEEEEEEEESMHAAKPETDPMAPLRP